MALTNNEWLLLFRARLALDLVFRNHEVCVALLNCKWVSDNQYDYAHETWKLLQLPLPTPGD